MPSEVKLILSLCTMLPSLVSGLLAFESVPIQLVQWLLKRENTWICNLAVYRGSHGSVSERFLAEKPKGETVPGHSCTTTSAALSKMYFQEINIVLVTCCKRSNLNSVLHLKIKGKEKQTKHFRDTSWRGSAYTVLWNVMVSDDSFLIALYRLKGVTPPFYTSHLVSFKTRAYDRTWMGSSTFLKLGITDLPY